MLTAVELLQCIGVGGWGWPISCSVSLKNVACLQFRKRAPSLASAAGATKKHNIAQRVKKAPFKFDGLGGVSVPTHEKMPTRLAVGVCLQKIQSVQIYIEDHVRSVKPDHGIGVCCQIIKQLFCFGHCALCSFRLLARYHAECHEHSEVNVGEGPSYSLAALPISLYRGYT